MPQRSRFGLEIIGVVCSAVAVLAWPALNDGLPSIDPALRTTIYGLCAQVFGALLGFVITALAIMLALPDTAGVQWLRRHRAMKKIFASFRSTATSLLIATGVSMAGVLVDRGPKPVAALVWLESYFSIRLGLLVAFALWALHGVVSVIGEDLERSESDEAPDLDSSRAGLD